MDGDESSEAADDEGGQSETGEQEEPTGSSTPGTQTDDPDAVPDDTTEPRAGDDPSDDSGDDGGDGDAGDAPDEPIEEDGAESRDIDDQTDDADEDADTGEDEGDADESEATDDQSSVDEGEEDEQDDDDEEGDEDDDQRGKFRGNPALEGRTGPEEDREMPLTEHVEEMLRRLAVVVAVAGIVSLVVFPVADQIINFLWYSILPGVETEIARPRVYALLELWFTRVKVASLAGLIVALPVLVYETYLFMRPGLYPHERRYYLAAIPTSLVLAIVGVSFAYFVVLPSIFTYFLYYSQDVATIGFALGRTFDLILLMMGYLAIVFQIPLFIMLAMMMGLVTRRWLADRRLLFWGAFLGVSFLFGFDPTGMAPILVAATMIALFEGTLLLTKWTGRE